MTACCQQPSGTTDCGTQAGVSGEPNVAESMAALPSDHCRSSSGPPSTWIQSSAASTRCQGDTDDGPIKNSIEEPRPRPSASAVGDSQTRLNHPPSGCGSRSSWRISELTSCETTSGESLPNGFRTPPRRLCRAVPEPACRELRADLPNHGDGRCRTSRGLATSSRQRFRIQ